MISLEQLQILCPQTPKSQLCLFPEAIDIAIEQFGIKKVPEFLAQIAHESMGFGYLREIWGPTPAQLRYEGRLDLGNTEPGDGARFKGRGFLQITGRANYEACGYALDLPLTHQPELLERPIPAARSAGWFWKSHNLDAIDDFERLTRRINGGVNGLADRYAYLGRAKEALEVA